jgi:stage II sporulation protein P
MKARRWLVLGAVVAVLVVGVASASRLPWFSRLTGRSGELQDGYNTVVDETGQVILTTAIAVARGDVFISDGNRGYRVERVQGRQATARFTGMIVPPARSVGSTAAAGLPSSLPDASPASTIPVGDREKLIVLYNTHSDESYAPTDGSASIDSGGGIRNVSRSLADMLKVRGFVVIQDTTNHQPHDINAYIRSRRTVMQYMLRYQPYALYDIHRDTPPADQYRTQIDGRTVAKVLIVVGRQNPLLQVNRAEAERIKSTADRLYPGLVRGIYLANGGYNQDLDAGLLLFEIGTQLQPREEAEWGAGYLGNVITAALNGQ